MQFEIIFEKQMIWTRSIQSEDKVIDVHHV